MRDVLGRYRGSALGVFWSFLNPLLMLAVFAVVFGTIFEGKFTGQPTESTWDFALALFAGLTVFGLFSECLARAPGLVVLNPSYVTKVVFPLEILPVVSVLAALVHLAVSVVPLVLGVWILRGHVPATMLLWPVLLVPLTCWALAVSWFVAALGVFLRDLGHVVVTLNLVLMYASAVFYPLAKAPEKLRPFIAANPLAFLAESSRNLAVWGLGLDWGQYALHLAVSVAALLAGRAFFLRTKPAFADVL